MDDDDWAANAPCRGKSDLFFYQVDREERGEARGGYTRAEQAAADKAEAEAKAICAECPLRRPCREHAFANRERFGIWAGMNEKELKVALSKRRPAPHARHRQVCDHCVGPFTADRFQRYCSVLCAKRAEAAS